MRSTIGAAVAVVVVAVGVLGVPWLSMAQAQVPTQDSVRATGNAIRAGGGGFFNLDFAVQSDPTGRNVSGDGTLSLGASGGPRIEGGASCLKVDGKTAYVEMFITYLDGNPFAPVVAKLVDGGPQGSGLDRFYATVSNGTSTNCGFPPLDTDYPVSGGDVVVVDAPPLPTSKDQCKNGGWRNYGDTFDNQGQCVAFVERGPSPKP
jgi:hypothetical protein